ncbi:terminase large subunit [uncultured Secundilactobacillus sp.]|uniref:terminase large subunit n=1 Tax=uncultured Secundilactobacillus sp. TaxID=2813935 RepID=UPI0025893DB0|nr:terminase TerL endonuclease subunit [uncultured Secundilactobacillus sp.]
MHNIDLSEKYNLTQTYQGLDFTNIRAHYTDAGTQYAFKVLEGQQVAGHMVKLAAFRHLRDLQRQDTTEFPFVYDQEAVKKVMVFANFTPDVDTGEPVQLMGWQQFIMAQLFGWKTLEGGVRFTKSLISVGRAQGKTMIAAIIMCYTFLIDSIGLTNQDYLVASINWKQTSKLLGYLKTMLRKIIEIEPFKGLAKQSNLMIQNDQIIMKKYNNVIRAISFESGQFDSFHFNTAVVDEVGELKSRDKTSKILSGQIKIDNRRYIQISTSYPDPKVPFYDDQRMLKKAMEEDFNRDADTYLCLVWAQDDLKEINQPETWAKSNPLLNLDDQKDKLLKGLIDKRDSDMLSGTIGDFQTKNMNLWLNEKENRYLDLKDINASIISDQAFNIDGRDVYIGFDASQYSDDTALAFVFPYLDGDRQKYHLYQHSFIPTSRTQQNIQIKENQDGIPYRDEEKRGFATISHTVGGDIDYSDVYNWLLDFVATHDLNVQVFLYDPWRSKVFIDKLEQEHNWLLEPVRQGTKSLDEPTSFLRHEMQNGNITMYDDRIMQAGMLNAVTLVDNNGIKIDKNLATDKIDCVDAIINCFYEAMLHFENFSRVEGDDDPFRGWKNEDVNDFFKNYTF